MVVLMSMGLVLFMQADVKVLEIETCRLTCLHNIHKSRLIQATQTFNCRLPSSPSPCPLSPSLLPVSPPVCGA